MGIMVTGPSGGNECCVCGYVLGHDPNNSRATGCPAKCTSSVNLSQTHLYDWWLIGDPSCMNYTCCPCPNTGDATRNAAVVFAGCEGGAATVDITMTPEVGASACTGGYVGDTWLGDMGYYCYWLENGGFGGGATVPIDIREQKYEKWAGSGMLCEDDSGGPGCSGQQIIVTTCCCGEMGGSISYGGPLDCHTCNYSTTLTFVPKPVDHYLQDGYCTCPSGDAWEMFPPERLLPGDYPGTMGHNASITPDLIAGECHDDGYLHTLVYKSSGLYFNCDCCSGGDQIGDDTIDLTITIT